MDITFSQVTLTFALLFVIMGCVAEDEHSKPHIGYLAFPRMGRSGYLAFPRMGRSQIKSETSSDVTACCGVGVKVEFLGADDGKEVIRTQCAPHLDCCEGLREVTEEKHGVYLSLCVPESPLSEETGVKTSGLINRLKHLIEK